ncbi:hypothetical protein CVT24_012460 [Panaeolus cyanescens]|uniref:Transposase family Tnp2 protein n=1 Tax=Panaeolus cyanescens TaxID=181874 RepID=A0A409WK88_9AGAR|nr:hypothetical protein CVT24_012460 [Panaeolus cyanescens]
MREALPLDSPPQDPNDRKRSRFRNLVLEDEQSRSTKRPRSESRHRTAENHASPQPHENLSPEAVQEAEPLSDMELSTGRLDMPSNPNEPKLPAPRFATRLKTAAANRWITRDLGLFIADHPSDDEVGDTDEDDDDYLPDLLPVSDDDESDDDESDNDKSDDDESDNDDSDDGNGEEETVQDDESRGSQASEGDSVGEVAANAYAARREAAAARAARIRAAQSRALDEDDLEILRTFSLKIEDHLTERTFSRLPQAYPNGPQLSLKLTKKHARKVSGLNAIRYSCCINSCICYVGPYADLLQCPHCKEDRFSARNTPRHYFDYIPLIPRLTAMVANQSSAKDMQYRAKFQSRKGIIQDIFDGTHYKKLCQTRLPDQDIKFFSDPRDIALGLSTDGFGPHRRRKKTCWPIILINYNLPPTLRILKKNVINVGTVPGPKKPQDWDSFFWPLAQELLELEEGVETFDGLEQSIFDLRAFLLVGFGDIPAVSLITRMKGQNGVHPCRSCMIKGVTGDGRVNYIPLRRDGIPHTSNYSASNLPHRTHQQFMQQVSDIEAAPTKVERDNLAKKFGVKGRPLLSSLSSIRFPASFPFDFMHLIWENLIPNLILFWTGEFKGLNHLNQPYVIAPNIWNEIGLATFKCARTVPSAFGAPVPNIVTQQYYMTAEMYSNWTLFIAPIVLRGRWEQRKYYDHFMDLVRLLHLCLDYEITKDEVALIESGFQEWVTKYERYYYFHDKARLSACPLTIHALLHIADGIRNAGPPSCYWAFVMERHCNALLPSIRNRRFPYAAISNYVLQVAQLEQIRLIFNVFDALNLDPVKHRQMPHIDPQKDYERFQLLSRHFEVLSPALQNLVWVSLVTRYWREKGRKLTKAMYKEHVPLNEAVLQFGKVRLGEDGDQIVGCDFIRLREDTRDSTFYVQDIDTLANQNNGTRFVEKTFFGQLKRIILIDVRKNRRLNIDHDETAIFAYIQTCNASERNGVYSYKEMGRDDLVDLCTLRCVVGRVWDRGQWTFVDRSRDF